MFGVKHKYARSQACLCFWGEVLLLDGIMLIVGCKSWDITKLHQYMIMKGEVAEALYPSSSLDRKSPASPSKHLDQAPAEALMPEVAIARLS